ncbi:hypothetical protein DM01DRAFT_1330963 [Hesseltinella vesiculosa]|uniref:Uncharacterized protein n=1 Tax=Hesseltinella vesiculosa TaxID=101127 RepID=A0A1X2GXN2_9FUNG|nr:hypothetical protein DM01DRAFT_1330963 [Hesseltinella vesiculosa]
MHPLLALTIFGSGAIVLMVGTGIVLHHINMHRERQEYHNYVRHFNQEFGPHEFTPASDDEDDDDRHPAKSTGAQHTNSTALRRRPVKETTPQAYEMDDLEREIARREQLVDQQRQEIAHLELKLLERQAMLERRQDLEDEEVRLHRQASELSLKLSKLDLLESKSNSRATSALDSRSDNNQHLSSVGLSESFQSSLMPPPQLPLREHTTISDDKSPYHTLSDRSPSPLSTTSDAHHQSQPLVSGEDVNDRITMSLAFPTSSTELEPHDMDLQSHDWNTDATSPLASVMSPHGSNSTRTHSVSSHAQSLSSYDLLNESDASDHHL